MIIGLSLVLSTGSVVYQKKQNSMLPENNPNIINSPSGSTEKNLVPSTNNKEYEGEIEGDDDDDDYTPSTTTTPTTKPTTTPTHTTTPTTTAGITMAQVASHASRTSCWSAINGSVYDLTSWIPEHPGGEQAILSLCGVDGSSAYNGQHGGSRRPASILAGFKLGALAK